MNAGTTTQRGPEASGGFLSVAAFHAGLVGIVLWTPLVSQILSNRHSLQLEWPSYWLVTAVFLVLPVLALAGLEKWAGIHGAAPMAGVRIAASLAALYVLLLQAAMAAHVGFPNFASAVAASVALVFIPAALLRWLRPGTRRLYGLGAGLVALIAVIAAAHPRLPLGYDRALWLALIAFAALAVAGAARHLWTQIQIFMRICGAIAVIVAVVFLASAFSYGPAEDKRGAAGRDPAPSEEGADRGPVFVLLFDGLSREALLGPDGQISERFAHLRRLADEGVWVRDAITNFDHTRNSVPSMLRGRKSDIDGLGDGPGLFEHLEGHYSAEIYGTVLDYCDHYPRAAVLRCSDSRSYFSEEGREDLLRLLLYMYVRGTLPWLLPPPSLALGVLEAKRGSIIMIEELLTTLESVPLAGRFYLTHVFSPHTPFIMEADGRFHERGPMNFHQAPSEEELGQAFEHYLREIDYVDSILGRLSVLLQRRGLWDSSTIVITADHGYTWQWGVHTWGSTLRNYVNEQVARIPFIIKPPTGFTGSGPLGAYQSIDLVPTLLDVLGIEPLPDAGLEGRSVFAGVADSRPLEVISTEGEPWVYRADIGRWTQLETSSETEESR